MHRSNKQVLKNGDEQDWVSLFWRRIHIYTEKPGVGKRIKRALNKRKRKEGKEETINTCD